MSLSANTGLETLFHRELELCGIFPGSRIGVLTQGRKRQAYAEAVGRAGTALGASVIHVDIGSDGTPNDGGELGVRAGATGLSTFDGGLVKTFQECDLLVDLVFLLWSEEQAAIRAAGTRIISCVEPPSVLKRLFPDAMLQERVRHADALLAGTRRLHITSAAGTDITYEIGQYHRLAQYGFSDAAGRWDHFASALVATVGNDAGVDGTVVFQPGDIFFPHTRYVADPVRLEVRRGRVVSIEGGLEAMLLKDYVAHFDDDAAYGVSHIGWGMSPAARWDVLGLTDWESVEAGTVGIGIDSRSFLGGVTFSTGPNVEFGGSNATACHMDIPMRGCTVHLDKQLVIDAGKVIPALMKPDPAAVPNPPTMEGA
jgi:2,5-dihydroxypyridine 5,6-dioxygenase